MKRAPSQLGYLARQLMVRPLAAALPMLAGAFWLVIVGGCMMIPKTKELPAPAPAPEPVVAPSPAPSAEPARPPESDLDTLIQYYAGLRRLAPAALAKEQEELRQQLAAAPSTQARIQMALVLSMPNNPNRDHGRALSVLDPVVKEAANSTASEGGLYNMALILQGLISENRRLESENKRLDETLQTTGQKLKEEQKQSELLQQKLEQLKSIEKGLLERNLPKSQAKPDKQSSDTAK